MNVLETMIKIGAAWTGGAAVAQAAGAAQKVEKSWLLADLSIKKVVSTLAAFGLGWKGVEAFSDFLKEGIANAREMRDAQEKLNMVIAGNAKFQKEAKRHHMDAAVAAREQGEALTKLAEKMSETGLKARTLETAWAGAIKAGLSPAAIQKNADALQTLVTRLGGIKAGTEEATHAMQVFRGAIQGGRGAQELAKMGIITYEEAKALKKMGSEAERAAWLLNKLGAAGKFTEKQFQTTAGQVERAHRNWEKLAETLGGPLVKSQDTFTIAMGKVALALQPIADQIAPKLTVVLDKLANSLANSGPYIIKFGEQLAKGFEFILAHWSEISKGLIAIGSSILIVKTALAGIKIVHDLVDGFTKLQAVVTNLPAILGLLTNPITLTIAAIAALGFAIYWMINHWDQVKTAATTAWNAITSAWGGAVSWFQGVFQGIAEATKSIWGPLVEPFQHLWASIQPIIQGIISLFTTAGDASAKGFNPVRYVLQGVIYDFNVLANWLRNVWTICTTMLGPALMQGLQNWGKAIGWVNANVIGPIIDAVAGIIDKLRVGDLWGAFQVWKNVVSQIQTNIVNGIVQVFTPIVQQISAVVGDLWNAFSKWASGIVQQMQAQVITPIVNLFGTLSSQIAAVIGSVYGAIIKPFVDAYNYIASLFSQLGASITSAVTNAVNAARSIPVIGSLIPGGKGKQHGGLVTSPGVMNLAERGIPEMVIPIQSGGRSRGLLSETASMLGMGGGMTKNVQGGAVNVNFSAPITITGVQGGQERALAGEVQRALQDPIRSLLDQLKKAKAEEARLAYA